MAESPERFGLEAQGFVLMDDHYHLVIRTPEPNLSHAIRWLHVTYSSRFNWAHREVGHVFQGRFKGVVMEELKGVSEVTGTRECKGIGRQPSHLQFPCFKNHPARRASSPAQMTSIEEFPGFNVVLEVDAPGDTLEDASATAHYDGMLAPPEDFSTGIAIFELRLEYVSRRKRAVLSVVPANKQLGSPVSVGPAWRAYEALDKYVETARQVPFLQVDGKICPFTE